MRIVRSSNFRCDTVTVTGGGMLNYMLSGNGDRSHLEAPSLPLFEAANILNCQRHGWAA